METDMHKADHHGQRKEDIRVMLLTSQEHGRFRAKRERGIEHSPLQPSGGTYPANTLVSTSTLPNCETTDFCCLSCSVWDALCTVAQLQENNIKPLFLISLGDFLYIPYFCKQY